MISIELAILFAEWIDVNCIKTNEHEWTCRLTYFKDSHSSKDVYEMFISEISSKE